jgi:2-polyprenyl-3-methyl-5-hydroxy-6-metoxy-1,4-benzoquinol methylase
MPTLQESLEALSTSKTTSISLHSQSTHRLNIFQSWLKIGQENCYDIESNIIGKQSLDIGCGQGDMIALFAAVLKAQGNKESKVTGVDPASLDYGEISVNVLHSFQTAQPVIRRTLYPW